MMKSTLEIWRDIKDYEGLYKVSNLGRVRSVDHLVNKWNGVRMVKGIIRKPVEHKNGYLQVMLCKDNHSKLHLVHRLVGIAFSDIIDWTEEAKGKPFDILQVNHKDELKNHNYIENLEWCTAPYNVNYGTANKRCSEKMTNNLLRSKPVLQYTLDGQFITEYPSCREVERQIGIAHESVSGCCKNKLKTAGGYKWKFKE